MKIFSLIETIFYFWSSFVQIILVMILIYSFGSFFLKKKFNSSHLRYNTFGLIISIIQLILGIIYIFMNDPNKLLIMKSMIDVISPILFIFMGWSLHNKQFDSRKKFLRIFFFYGIGFLLLTINYQVI